jgi:hypothetical protein
LGMGLFESLINELYFQGFTILDQIKRIFYIDMIDPKVGTIDLRHFNSVAILYTDDEKTDKERQENFQLIQLLCGSKKQKKPCELSLREYMIKLFVTIVSKYIFNRRKLE